MAKKHRKLFPIETTTNQTQDCSGFCDPACPYNCYSYPDYYFSPPPPISIDDHSSNINHISSYLIILVSLFAVIFVVVGFYVIKLKCYADWCGWRVNGSGSVPSQSNNSEDEFLNENQVDHPVWLITTIGLQQSIINSISVCKFRKDEGLIEGTECSVCLNEFQEGETLRLLPKCNHAFHIPCIDTWLRSHTNCPLCRAGIVSNNVVSEAFGSNNLDSVEHENNSNSGRNQENMMMENSRNDDGLLLGNNIVTNLALENSAGTGEASGALDFTDESCFKERVIVNNDQTEDQGVQNDEIQIDVRPVSPAANYSSRESEIHAIDHAEDDTMLQMVSVSKEAGDESRTSGTMRRSSIEECLHISPVSMKRSVSCSGRILCARGYYMSLNSTLPY